VLKWSGVASYNAILCIQKRTVILHLRTHMRHKFPLNLTPLSPLPLRPSSHSLAPHNRMLSVDQGQNNADAARRDMEFKRRSVSIKLLNINEDDDDEVR
jgi:hypothetical protein